MDLPGPRDPTLTPYLLPLYGWADNVTGIVGKYSRLARYETAVLITSTQSGKTEACFDIMGWRLRMRPRPQLYAGPDQNFVRQQIDPRLDAMLQQSFADDYDTENSTKTLKYVRGTKIRLGWGGSAASLASDQAGDGFVDEYDKMFQAQRQMGDPYNLVKARGDTYADRKFLVTSTPTEGSVKTYRCKVSGLEFWEKVDERTDLEVNIPSHIWRRWQTGTMHHVAWCCPHCDDWFIPRMSLLQYPKGSSSGRALRETWLACPNCGGEITNDMQAKLNANLRIVAPGERIDDKGDVVGEPENDTNVFSLWVSGLCSPFVKWGERAAEYLEAVKSGERESIQGVINNAGEVWSPLTIKEMKQDEALKKCVDYSFKQVPRQVLLVTMGVDVQGNRLVVVVRGWGARARSYLLHCDEIYGRTSETEVWAKLANMFDWQFGGLRINKVCIDAGFRPDKKDAGDYHKVLDFCRRYAWIAHATRGKAKQATAIISRREEVTAEGKSEKFGLEVLSVDTDYFKGRWYSQLSTVVDDPGSAHLPTLGPDERHPCWDQYLKQIVSEVRAEDGKWHALGANHFLDAEVLAGVAGYMLKAHHIADGNYRDVGGEEDETVITPEMVKIVTQQVSTAAERAARMAQGFNRR